MTEDSGNGSGDRLARLVERTAPYRWERYLLWTVVILCAGADVALDLGWASLHAIGGFP